MSEDFIRNVLVQCRERFGAAVSSKDLLSLASAVIGEVLSCDRVAIYRVSETENLNGEWRKSVDEKVSIKPLFELRDLATRSGQDIPSLFIHDIKRSALTKPLMERLTVQQVLSVATLPLVLHGETRGWIECHFTETYYRWRREDAVLLTQIADYISLFLEKLIEIEEPKAKKAKPSEQELRYERLAEYGNLIIIRTDVQFRVLHVIGNTQRILGLKAEELLNDSKVWSSLLHPLDLRRLQLKILRLKTIHFQINEEIRVLTPWGQRWLHLKAVPLSSPTNEFLGWEGFGIDITEQREAEDSLVSERRRIEALYEVGRSLQVSADPPTVAHRGLKSLVAATNSDAGFGCLYDRTTGRIDIVASEGLSTPFIENASQVLKEKGLVRQSIEGKEEFFIEDIQNDPRAATDIVRAEGLRSTMIVPFKFEGEVLGVVVLYCRKAAKYTHADFELVTAASSQIGLAARQAEIAAQERLQIHWLSVLYELSHEVSKHLTPREVAEHAFPILQKELLCRRMWIGVLNDQGTHIVGQGGFGPGVRAGLLSVQIELELQHDQFDQAIRTKQPVVVEAGTQMECSGLNRVIEKLEIGTFIIVPLVSVGSVVGVLVAEPSMPAAFFGQKKLGLLTSMANEIASVVMARRFEGKMAEANKMRMASLLSSGVAHNFNNLLQAIMGQASLLEVQIPPDSPLSGSARMIMAAAEKGAGLIRQLLTFTTASEFSPLKASVNKLLSDSEELYRSVVGREIAFQLKLEKDLPDVRMDFRQVQQVITNLLLNAKEAITDRSEGHVELRTAKVRLRSGEVDPDLPPGLYVRIDVEDNGVGMDAEKQSRCFEPFFTTKTTDANTGLGFGGVGLGLSSAYAMIKSHEGVITVSSEAGSGATFSIYLPVRESTMEEPLISQIEHVVTSQSNGNGTHTEHPNPRPIPIEVGSE